MAYVSEKTSNTAQFNLWCPEAMKDRVDRIVETYNRGRSYKTNQSAVGRLAIERLFAMADKEIVALIGDKRAADAGVVAADSPEPSAPGVLERVRSQEDPQTRRKKKRA